jgi:thioredoxin-dependent peroxiredoxin
MLKVGDQSPNFELLNQDVRPVRLSDFRGKPVVIFTFPAAGTMGCTMQACDLRDSFPRIAQENAAILGISPDSPADLKAWQQRERLCYDLLSDPDHRVLSAFGVWGLDLKLIKLNRTNRTLWVLDENGVIFARHAPVMLWESSKRALDALASMPRQART